MLFSSRVILGQILQSTGAGSGSIIRKNSRNKEGFAGEIKQLPAICFQPPSAYMSLLLSYSLVTLVCDSSDLLCIAL